ncbi:MAG: sulfotransferase, partial [Terrimicrobiaceae bacterium]|nr:sulfotransferase [Terrimicrobiaceae bacterium]
MNNRPAHAPEPGTFFVLGLHNTGTSTLVAMLNSHPRILICYETWSQPPMLAKYAMDLCREEPALREIFSGRLGIVEAFARAGQILAERGCKYQWVGDKQVALSLPDLEALASSPAVYVWRPLDEWLVKREVRRAYCTDFDAKTPALHFLSCLNTASSQDRWLCLPMAEIFRDPPAFFGRVARLLGVEPSGFDLEWWKTAASPADRIKASMRWTEAHPSSFLPPQTTSDVSIVRAAHPFWDATDEILARLAGCSVSGGSQARRAEIEEAITRLGRDFPRLPLSLLYHSFKEWRHGQPHALGPKPGHRLSAGLRSLRALWGGVRPAPEAGAKSPVSGSEDSARQAAASASDSTSHTGEKAARPPDLSPRELLRD